MSRTKGMTIDSRTKGMTIDEVLDEQAGGEIVDPILAAHVNELDVVAIRFRKFFGAKDWAKNYIALLGVCHILQRIRLEYGDLGLMDRTSQTKILNILTKVIHSFGKAPRFTDYLSHFSMGQQRDWAKKAVVNINGRFLELMGDDL